MPKLKMVVRYAIIIFVLLLPHFQPVQRSLMIIGERPLALTAVSGFLYLP